MFTESKGASIRYEVSGEGIPVLLIGGFWTDVHYWDRLTPMLDGCRVATFDCRGCGETEYDGPFDMDDQAEDAFAVMDAAGFESAHVVGWSMGSLIAQRMMSMHPDRVRSASLISTYPRRPARSRYLFIGILERIEAGATDIESLAIAVNSLALTEDYFGKAERRGDRPGVPDVRTTPEGLRHQLDSVEGYRMGDSLSDSRIPTMVIHGAEDEMVHPELGRAVADAIPDSIVLEVPGAGHIVPPRGYAAEMLEFIRNHNDFPQ